MIWENPYPEAEITSIAAKCDYENYPYLIVTIGQAPYGKLIAAVYTQLITTNVSTELSAIGLGTGYNRTITYDSGKITFTTKNSSGSGGKYTIPVRIYGVTDLESLPYLLD